MSHHLNNDVNMDDEDDMFSCFERKRKIPDSDAIVSNTQIIVHTTFNFIITFILEL